MRGRGIFKDFLGVQVQQADITVNNTVSMFKYILTIVPLQFGGTLFFLGGNRWGQGRF
jgi:hypothetical protein